MSSMWTMLAEPLQLSSLFLTPPRLTRLRLPSPILTPSLSTLFICACLLPILAPRSPRRFGLPSDSAMVSCCDTLGVLLVGVCMMRIIDAVFGCFFFGGGFPHWILVVEGLYLWHDCTEYCVLKFFEMYCSVRFGYCCNVRTVYPFCYCTVLIMIDYTCNSDILICVYIIRAPLYWSFFFIIKNGYWTIYAVYRSTQTSNKNADYLLLYSINYSTEIRWNCSDTSAIVQCIPLVL